MPALTGRLFLPSRAPSPPVVAIGYGDITPVTTSARLVNALLVTPMRLLFVLVLVGTTIQVLTERSREQFKRSRWRSRVKGHVIVCGYGTKGRAAVRSLLQRDHPRELLVVVDEDPAAVSDATAAGLVAVQGSATSERALQEAVVERAGTVVVAVSRDDTAVLVTLTARRLNPQLTVVAAVREEENVDLLRQSGAESVITSSGAAGRLLGLATDSPRTVEVIEDLLAFGHGLDLVEREVHADEAGRGPHGLGVPVVAVVRDGRTLHYDDPDAGPLRVGDRVIHVTGRPRTGPARVGTGPEPPRADG